MRRKAKLDSLFLLIIPALVFVVLIITATIAYNSAYDKEKSWTTEYFAMLADSCADEADETISQMCSETERAGALISTSKLAADAMTASFNTVIGTDGEKSAMVVAGGMLVYGASSSIYSTFADFIGTISADNPTAVSDVIQCEDGAYRLAVGTYVTMDYGSHVSVFLVYPVTSLEKIINIPKIADAGIIHLVQSDGVFLTGKSSIDRLGDQKNSCSSELLAEADGKLTEYKEYNSGDNYLAYTKKLDINDWHVYCAVSASAVRQRMSQSVGMLLRITIISLIVLFATFLYYYYGTNKTNRRRIIERKKFVIAARQSARAVFEYDTLKDKFFLINDCEKISLPGGVDYLSRAMGLSYIFPEDVEELKRLFEVLRHEPTASATVRACYFCGENIYHWYYITATRLSSRGLGSTVIIGIMEDIDEREKERIALLQKATTDSLTGLYNRAETTRLVNKRLSDPIEGSASAFIIFDLDDFKGINDTHGHEIGDKVLRFFADKLKATFRTEDVVGRLGGDEFVVYMTYNADDDFVQRRFAVFADSITKRRSGDDDLPYIFCSAGYVTAMPGDEFETMYRRADKALYRAKTIGKNCAVCGD